MVDSMNEFSRCFECGNYAFECMCPSLGQESTEKSCLHFVGFKGDEFHSAVKIFGLPDFFHRVHDKRAVAEFCENDMVVFANGSENRFKEFTFDDSQHF